MIYENDFIYNLFKQKLDNNEFKLNDNKLNKMQERRRYCNKKMYDFINTKIPYKTRIKLKNLIEDYKEAKVECCMMENQLFYKYGFKDGLEIQESLKKI